MPVGEQDLQARADAIGRFYTAVAVASTLVRTPVRDREAWSWSGRAAEGSRSFAHVAALTATGGGGGAVSRWQAITS